MKKASLMPLQAENPSGLFQIGESIPYAMYTDKHFLSGPQKDGFEIFRAKRIGSLDKEDFYAFAKPSEKSLATLFTVQNESDGDLLVVFVADISKDGQVKSTLILTDSAWQEVLASNQKVMRVEQFYLHILEKQMNAFA